jgi:hypothetical protein
MKENEEYVILFHNFTLKFSLGIVSVSTDAAHLLQALESEELEERAH